MPSLQEASSKTYEAVKLLAWLRNISINYLRVKWFVYNQ